MKKLLLSIMFMVPLSARADLVVYDFAGEAEGGWSVSGEVVLNEGDAVAATNLVDSFVSWSFSWTDGSLSFGASSEDSYWSYDEFYLGSDGYVAYSELCTSTCRNGDAAAVYVVGDTIALWIAGIPSAAGGATPGGTGLWSAPQILAPQSAESRIADVPEPGTLTLLGLGLAGIAAGRRRKSAG